MWVGHLNCLCLSRWNNELLVCTKNPAHVNKQGLCIQEGVVALVAYIAVREAFSLTQGNLVISPDFAATI